MQRDVYSVTSKLHGEEREATLRATCGYASALARLERYGEAKSLLKKRIPVAQRVLGTSDSLTLRMRGCYAQSLYLDAGATLDDLHEAVTTLEDAERIARRVLGSVHPVTEKIEESLLLARASLRARETPDA